MAPQELAADKGYSSAKNRQILEELGIEDVIARRKDERQPSDGWLKQCRAVATRYDKLATNFLGTLRLAIIRLLLKRLA